MAIELSSVEKLIDDELEIAFLLDKATGEMTIAGTFPSFEDFFSKILDVYKQFQPTAKSPEVNNFLKEKMQQSVAQVKEVEPVSKIEPRKVIQAVEATEVVEPEIVQESFPNVVGNSEEGYKYVEPDSGNKFPIVGEPSNNMRRIMTPNGAIMYVSMANTIVEPNKAKLPAFYDKNATMTAMNMGGN